MAHPATIPKLLPPKLNMEPANDVFQSRNLLFQGLILGWTMLNFRGVKPVVLPVFVSHTPCLACCVANTLVSKWRRASNKNPWHRWTKIPAIALLPETNSLLAPENWWLGVGRRSFPLGFRPIFRAKMLVFGRLLDVFLKLIRNCCSPMSNAQKLKFNQTF